MSNFVVRDTETLRRATFALLREFDQVTFNKHGDAEFTVEGVDVRIENFDPSPMVTFSKPIPFTSDTLAVISDYLSALEAAPAWTDI